MNVPAWMVWGQEGWVVGSGRRGRGGGVRQVNRMGRIHCFNSTDIVIYQTCMEFHGLFSYLGVTSPPPRMLCFLAVLVFVPEAS